MNGATPDQVRRSQRNGMVIPAADLRRGETFAELGSMFSKTIVHFLDGAPKGATDLRITINLEMDE